MRYTYLLIDVCTIGVPLLFSFHPRIKFYKTWNALWPAIGITTFFFVAWDSLFTWLGVWGFNPRYVMGVYLGNMPLEEVLFFICIPYSCVFTFYCLTKVINGSNFRTAARFINPLLIAVAMVIALYYHGRFYTVFAFALLSVLIAVSYYGFKVKWLPQFYLVYLVLLIPFLIVNGLLTGTGLSEPVVWYNNIEIIGLRILTIPFEDIFYGASLVLMNLLIYSRSSALRL